ncbi:unnamed protein product [Ectocarpus sp. 13 AM-2016]
MASTVLRRYRHCVKHPAHKRATAQSSGGKYRGQDWHANQDQLRHVSKFKKVYATDSAVTKSRTSNQTMTPLKKYEDIVDMSWYSKISTPSAVNIERFRRPITAQATIGLIVGQPKFVHGSLYSQRAEGARRSDPHRKSSKAEERTNMSRNSHCKPSP